MRGVAAAVGGRRDAVGPVVRSDGGHSGLRPVRQPPFQSGVPRGGGHAVPVAAAHHVDVVRVLPQRGGLRELGPGRLVSEKSGTCLDATGPSSANGTPLQIWACAYSDNQRWQLPAGVPTGHIGGLGGKCADLGGSGSTNAAGTAVQLNTCGTGVSQDWSVAADGTVQVLGDCMGVANNGTASGTAVTLQVCNGSNGQKWTTGADGSLVNTSSGRCLDATDASSANGTKLQIWTCGGSAQQRWSLPASV